MATRKSEGSNANQSVQAGVTNPKQGDEVSKSVEQLEAEARLRSFANPEVPDVEARKVNALSQLVSSEEDVMTIHAQVTARLFNGYSPVNQDGNKYYIPGAKRAAQCLRQLFVLTSRDNPYADAALIEIEAVAGEVAARLKSSTRTHTQLLEARAKRGISYNLVSALKPQELSLGFKSPYGHMLSNMLVDFDFLARVLRTAEHRDLISRTESERELGNVRALFRNMFYEIIRRTAALNQEDLSGLCRGDWLADAAPAAKKRLQLAQSTLGVVSEAVLLAKVEPRHSMRRYKMNKQERSILEAVLKQENLENENAPLPDEGVVDGMVE